MGFSGKTLILAIVSIGVAPLPARADTCTYGYDQFGRLTSVTCVEKSVTTLTITYSYDDAGNRKVQTKTP
jgi:YD repeat-containing protein